MAGPWEKYKTAPQEGPWAKYGGQDQGRRSVGRLLYENVIGSGAVDTPGERVGHLINQAGSGFVRGAAGLVDAALTGGRAQAEATPQGVVMERPAAPAFGAVDPALPKPETTADEYAQTVGSFLPGMLAFSPMMAGGASLGNMTKFAAVPGIASEAAGQATEGTRFEPAARLGAAMLAPAAASGVAALGRSAVGAPKPPSMFSGMDDIERQKLANTLVREDVPVFAGQARDSATLRAMEGVHAPTGAQTQAFTGAALRAMGSKAKAATPEALKAAQGKILADIDSVIGRTSVTMSDDLATRAASIADDYVRDAPSASVIPRVKIITDEIMDAATTPGGKPIDLVQLRKWRTALGRMSVSPDEATRTAAHGLRGVIDDATDAALRAAGREADIPRLATAREQYRNFIAVRDAASRAGAETGQLSPTQLNQSLIRSQGRENYAVGATTPMAELTRAGAGILRQEPTVLPGGVRAIQGAVPMGMAGAGAAGGFAVGNLPGAIIGAGAAGSLPMIGQAGMRSNIMQEILRNPSLARQMSIGAIPGFATSEMAQ